MKMVIFHSRLFVYQRVIIITPIEALVSLASPPVAAAILVLLTQGRAGFHSPKGQRDQDRSARHIYQNTIRW